MSTNILDDATKVVLKKMDPPNSRTEYIQSDVVPRVQLQTELNLTQSFLCWDCRITCRKIAQVGVHGAPLRLVLFGGRCHYGFLLLGTPVLFDLGKH
jgi:hypothetical protein